MLELQGEAYGLHKEHSLSLQLYRQNTPTSYCPQSRTMSSTPCWVYQLSDVTARLTHFQHCVSTPHNRWDGCFSLSLVHEETKAQKG